jgi:hypothetical protein
MERQRLKDLVQNEMAITGTQILQSPLGSIRMTSWALRKIRVAIGEIAFINRVTARSWRLRV